METVDLLSFRPKLGTWFEKRHVDHPPWPSFAQERNLTMYYGWAPYVPVGQRLGNAKVEARKHAKKLGREPSPVQATGRKIATKFWGLAWCDNLDQYSDFSNRLPRGRTYLRNGSVVDLHIKPGGIEALVAGSNTYRVNIDIAALSPATWKSLQRDCAESITSLLDLLQGRFDEGVMRRLARRDGGLFPQPKEIKMKCSCPDYAYVCKHIAAVIYGVGVRLDTAPELLFTLRKVDHTELISRAIATDNMSQTLNGKSSEFAGTDLGELFGIDLADATASSTPNRASPTGAKKKRTRTVSAEKVSVKRGPKTAVKSVATKKRAPRKKSAKPAVKRNRVAK